MVHVPKSVTHCALVRRQKRWAKELAEQDQTNAHLALVEAIAKWKGVPINKVKISHTYCCGKAPADLGCVYISSFNPLNNPCVFCGSPEEDIF